MRISMSPEAVPTPVGVNRDDIARLPVRARRPHARGGEPSPQKV